MQQQSLLVFCTAARSQGGDDFDDELADDKEFNKQVTGEYD